MAGDWRDLPLTLLRMPCCWASDRPDKCKEPELLRTCTRALASMPQKAWVLTPASSTPIWLTLWKDSTWGDRQEG